MVETGLGIALLATPAGWIFIIGASITAGIVTAKFGDDLGKFSANQVYDFSTRLNSL